jgi:hypothetical protein
MMGMPGMMPQNMMGMPGMMPQNMMGMPGMMPQNMMGMGQTGGGDTGITKIDNIITPGYLTNMIGGNKKKENFFF